MASTARLPMAPVVCGEPIFLPLRSARDAIGEPLGTRISDTLAAATVPGATYLNLILLFCSISIVDT